MKRIRSFAGFVALAGILALFVVVGCNDGSKPTNATTYKVTIGSLSGGEIVATPNRAKEKAEVTLTIQPDFGSAYISDSLTIKQGAKDIEYTVAGHEPEGVVKVKFKMPKGDVTVSALFKEVESHRITIASGILYGTFETEPEDMQFESWLVTIYANPNSGFQVDPSSLKITGATSNTEYIPQEVSDIEFTFLMPAEDVNIYGEFIDENISIYAIFYEAIGNGQIDGPERAPAGKVVTIFPNATGGGGISYEPGSLSITGDSSGDSIAYEASGVNFKFTMPDEDVLVKATFSAVTQYNIVLELEGEADKAEWVCSAPTMRAGENVGITITLKIDEGYHWLGQNKDDPSNSFSITGVDDWEKKGGKSWGFVMPGNDVSATVTIVAGEEDPEPRYKVQWASPAGGELTFASISSTDGTPDFEAGWDVTITAAADPGYQVGTQDPAVALTEPPATEVTPVTKDPAQPKWTFRMPAADVTVTYAFEKKKVTLTITAPAPADGTLTVTNGDTPVATGTAVEVGTTLKVTATPAEERQAADSPTAVANIDFGAAADAAGVKTWTFTIPSDFTAAQIGISVPFTTKTYEVTKGTITAGSDISFTGLVEGKAAKGVTVTIIAAPANAGVATGVGGISVTGNVAVTKASKTSFTFVMPGNAVTVNVTFSAEYVPEGAKAIYSNGAWLQEGLSIGANVVQPSYFQDAGNYASVDPQHDITVDARPGSTNTKAIRVGRGNNNEVAFSIKATTPIDLKGTGGLSFWIYYGGRTGGEWSPIEWIGFGNHTNNGKCIVWRGLLNDGNWRLSPNSVHGWFRVIVPVYAIPADFTTNAVFSILCNVGVEEQENFFLIDDIEFLAGEDIELAGITIPDSVPAIDHTTPVKISGITFNYAPTPVSGITTSATTIIANLRDAPSQPASAPSPAQVFNPWDLVNNYNFIIDPATHATKTGTNDDPSFTPTAAAQGSSFTVSLSIGVGTSAKTSNPMLVPVAAAGQKILNDFQSDRARLEFGGAWSYRDNAIINGRAAGAVQWMPAFGGETFTEDLGTKWCAMGTMFFNNHVGLNGYANIKFNVRVPDNYTAPQEDFKFYLRSGDNWFQYNQAITHDGNTVKEITITLNAGNFVTPSVIIGNMVTGGTFNLADVSAFAVGILRVDETNADACRLYINDVIAYE